VAVTLLELVVPFVENDGEDSPEGVDVVTQVYVSADDPVAPTENVAVVPVTGLGLTAAAAVMVGAVSVTAGVVNVVLAETKPFTITFSVYVPAGNPKGKVNLVVSGVAPVSTPVVLQL
jgi:hypothetical protein